MLTAIVFALMRLPGDAEQVIVKVHVDPPNAIVKVDGVVEQSAAQPLALELPASGDKSFEFTLSADGYVPKVISLTAPELRGSRRLPSQGTYRLEPVGSGSWLAPGLALLVLGVGAGGFILGRRGRQQQTPPSTRLPQTTSGRADPIPPTGPPYVIKEKIAEGGMAIIYRGTSPKAPGREVAIKVVRPELLEDRDTKKRFLREIEICSKLNHPNLVRMYDTGVGPDGETYLVMELLEGRTLSEELDDDIQPPREKIANILLPLCKALAYIHKKGMVHRDVKPSNIFLDRTGVKLVDLGIARGLEFEAITRTGMAVGSPHYMAPEQAKGEVRPESDQYAVGVILFEMLTGDRPYPEGDPIEVITQHLTAPVPSIFHEVPDASPLLEVVVQRLMAKRPETRFPSITEAAQAIETALADIGDLDDATCGVIIPN